MPKSTNNKNCDLIFGGLVTPLLYLVELHQICCQVASSKMMRRHSSTTARKLGAWIYMYIYIYIYIYMYFWVRYGLWFASGMWSLLFDTETHRQIRAHRGSLRRYHQQPYSQDSGQASHDETQSWYSCTYHLAKRATPSCSDTLGS